MLRASSRQQSTISGFLQADNASIVLVLSSRLCGIKRNVRRRLIQFGTVLILTLCIWGHLSELFDHWDNTFRTGYDIEYSTVIVVLVAGAIIAFAHLLVNVIRSVSATRFCLRLFTFHTLVLPIPAVFIGHSPPLSLRI